MNNQFENMQKLAFGKTLIKESMKGEKMKKSAFKAKIKEMILAEINGEEPKEEFSRKIGQELTQRLKLGKINQKQHDDALEYLATDNNEYELFHQKDGGRENIIKVVDKILKQISTELDEAKKKKKEPEDVAPQEDIDIDMGTEETEIETPPTDTISPETSAEVDIDPKVKAIQDALNKALANAKALNDEKLVNQIGNTITMLVRTQVVGQQAVAENIKK